MWILVKGQYLTYKPFLAILARDGGQQITNHLEPAPADLNPAHSGDVSRIFYFFLSLNSRALLQWRYLLQNLLFLHLYAISLARFWQSKMQIERKAQSHASSSSFMNSSFESFTSLIIFKRSPMPILSPAWTGITVILPSSCFMTTWLPRFLAILNPKFDSVFMSFLADGGLKLNEQEPLRTENRPIQCPLSILNLLPPNKLR